MEGAGAEQIKFKDKTIEELMKSHLKDPTKTKVNNEAVKMTSGKDLKCEEPIRAGTGLKISGFELHWALRIELGHS